MGKGKDKEKDKAETPSPRGPFVKGDQGQTVRLPSGPTGPRGRLCQVLRLTASASDAQVFEDALRMIEELTKKVVATGGEKKAAK